MQTRFQTALLKEVGSHDTVYCGDPDAMYDEVELVLQQLVQDHFRHLDLIKRFLTTDARHAVLEDMRTCLLAENHSLLAELDGVQAELAQLDTYDRRTQHVAIAIVSNIQHLVTELSPRHEKQMRVYFAEADALSAERRILRKQISDDNRRRSRVLEDVGPLLANLKQMNDFSCENPRLQRVLELVKEIGEMFSLEIRLAKETQL